MSSRTLSALLAPLVVLGLAACATTPPAGGSLSPSPTVASPAPTDAASATPVDSATPTVSATPTASPTGGTADALELRGDGLGAYAFGAKQADVTALLEDRLGHPDESSQGIRCELDDASPWVQTVSWGPLWVEYDALDASKKSPRTLAAWGYDVKSEPGDQLRIADDVPLTLSFAQLKAKYPKGKTQDLGLGDGSKRFILPNKLFFVGSGARPSQLQAGAFSTCE